MDEHTYIYTTFSVHTHTHTNRSQENWALKEGKDGHNWLNQMYGKYNAQSQKPHKDRDDVEVAVVMHTINIKHKNIKKIKSNSYRQQSSCVLSDQKLPWQILLMINTNTKEKYEKNVI